MYNFSQTASRYDKLIMRLSFYLHQVKHIIIILHWSKCSMFMVSRLMHKYHRCLSSIVQGSTGKQNRADFTFLQVIIHHIEATPFIYSKVISPQMINGQSFCGILEQIEWSLLSVTMEFLIFQVQVKRY